MSRLEFEVTHDRERMLVDRNHVGYGYRLDYCELARSALADGGYYFFTCSCGEPGCAGIHEPTIVTSDADKIYWHMIEPEPEGWFAFQRASYLEAIREAIGTYLRLYSGKSAHRRR